MTMTGFWQLIQKWKMGCTLQRYPYREGDCVSQPGHMPKKKWGCKEGRFRVKGMGSLLRAGREGWSRNRHGLKMLRRLLTLKKLCQMRRASGQNRQAMGNLGCLRNWLHGLHPPTSWKVEHRGRCHPKTAARSGTRLGANVLGWSVRKKQQFKTLDDILASGQTKL